MKAGKGFLLRTWAYFRRAHSVYFAYAISFTNFITITYTLLFVKLLGAPANITYYTIYAVVFLITYFITVALVGRWDYRRGSIPVETTLIAKNNPYNQDLAKALILIAQGRNEEAVKIMSKWIRE